MMKIKPQVIGLMGRAGSGKDAAAQVLMQEHKFVRVAFGDGVKQEVADSFCIPRSLLTIRETKEQKTPALAICQSLNASFIDRMITLNECIYSPRSPREIMQFWGTEYRRLDDKHYWVQRTKHEIQDLIQDGQTKIVVSDVRFDNEAALIESKFNGRIWFISRPIVDSMPVLHISEDIGIFLQRRPLIVDNSGSLKLLHSAVTNAYQDQSQIDTDVDENLGT